MTRPLFGYPFVGDFPVSSPYGPRGGGMHTGTDFAVPSGAPIYASNDGQVIYAAREEGAGNTVTISGADGWQSRYHHLQSWIVGVGQHVARGTLIAFCDNTGSSTGPHLHFEIRPTPSTTTDPVPILQADAGASGPPSNGGGNGGFTVSQMDQIAQWEQDTRAVILNALVGDAWKGIPPPTGILAAWEADTRNIILRGTAQMLSSVTRALDAVPTDAEGRPTIDLAEIRTRVLEAVDIGTDEDGG